MKLIKINKETHQAFKMYCVSKNVNMSDKATEILNHFLLKEAGGTTHEPTK
jgi:hypothetical protein